MRTYDSYLEDAAQAELHASWRVGLGASLLFATGYVFVGFGFLVAASWAAEDVEAELEYSLTNILVAIFSMMNAAEGVSSMKPALKSISKAKGAAA